MDYTVKSCAEKGRIQSCISGQVIIESARECALETFALAAAQSCRKILVDCRRATADTGISDIHGFYSRLDQFGCDRRMSVAIVFSGDPDKYQFIETVARNRGFDVRVFRELAVAEAWLAGEPALSSAAACSAASTTGAVRSPAR